MRIISEWFGLSQKKFELESYQLWLIKFSISLDFIFEIAQINKMCF